jgi:hypothetical protein
MKQKIKFFEDEIIQKKSDQIMVKYLLANSIIFKIHIWHFVVS